MSSKIRSVVFSSAGIAVVLLACSEAPRGERVGTSSSLASVWDESVAVPQQGGAPGTAFHFDRWVSCAELGLGNTSVVFRPPYPPDFAPNVGCGVDGGGRFDVALGSGQVARLSSGYCFDFAWTSTVALDAFLLRGTDYGAVLAGADPNSDAAKPVTKVNVYEPPATSGSSSTPPRPLDGSGITLAEYYTNPGSYADWTSTPREVELCFTVDGGVPDGGTGTDAGTGSDAGSDAGAPPRDAGAPDADGGEIRGGKSW